MKTLQKETLYRLDGLKSRMNPTKEDRCSAAIGLYPKTATGTVYFSLSSVQPTSLAEMETQAEGTGFNGTLALSTIPVWMYITEDSGVLSDIQVTDKVLIAETIDGPLT